MKYTDRIQHQLHSLQTRLPAPAPEAVEHSEKLYQHLCKELAAGPMLFSDFMQTCLYEPGLGYYSAGATKIGAAGDFVTAPELSPLFSQALANQCAQVLSSVSGDILELGAGRGTMARDLLLHLQSLNQLPDRYLILEVSADLRQIQKETLSTLPQSLFDKVQWISALPQAFSGVILANEVLDAIPATRWLWRDGSLYECAVKLNEDDNFDWVEQAPSDELSTWFATLPKEMVAALPNAYQSECHLLHESFIQSIADCLQCGVALFIDYGMAQHEYYLPERNDGTLLCYYRHHNHSQPLILVGLQDITAHVQFTHIAEAGLNAGMDLLGYAPQAAFLQSLGILELAQHASDLKVHLNHAQALKRLLMPHEMGESFKVMAFGKAYDHSLQGFSLLDARERLG